MARYIDAELALKIIDNYSKSVTEDGKVVVDAIKDIVAVITPTADVVPKSDYDNLKSQFDALDHECDRLERAESNRHDAIEQAKTEVAREIFADLEMYVEEHNGCSVNLSRCEFAELKKKYTNN